ncbi:MAG: hypothetical protein CMD14_02715 [Flavobacteriales bacterium]|nr:hypothetical protein [Flavobacteriales bacterium]
MKIYLIILFLLMQFSVFAQLKSLTYEQSQDISFVEQYTNNTEIDSYISKDGITIGVGDTLIIGKALIDRENYMYDDVFSYIVIGNTKGTRTKEFRSLPHNYSGDKVVVKSLFVVHKKYTGYKLFPKRKKMPLSVNIFVKDLKSNRSLFSYSRKTILDIEEAFSSGEIVNSNALPLRKEAIRILKEKKDLMDLGFITKEEYEILKEKLSPVILQK